MLSSSAQAGGAALAGGTAAAGGAVLSKAVSALWYRPQPGAAEEMAAAEAAGALLVVDQPWATQLRLHAPKLVWWAILEVLVIWTGVKQVGRGCLQRGRSSRHCGEQ